MSARQKKPQQSPLIPFLEIDHLTKSALHNLQFELCIFEILCKILSSVTTEAGTLLENWLLDPSPVHCTFHLVRAISLLLQRCNGSQCCQDPFHPLKRSLGWFHCIQFHGHENWELASLFRNVDAKFLLIDNILSTYHANFFGAHFCIDHGSGPGKILQSLPIWISICPPQ